MKKIYSGLLLLFCLSANAQNSATITINKIRTTVYSNGDLFRSDTNPPTQEEAPAGSDRKINFQGRLWLSGKDNNDNLHTATGFKPGPLDTATATADSVTNLPYDHVWKINRSMIQYFQQVYQNNPEFIPVDILSWPGNGTGGQAHKLAPFVDLNNNDIYEPFLGDYPELHGDEMLFFIASDYGNNLNNGCSNLGMELHCMVYAYACDSIKPDTDNEALNNTVFYRYTLYNRTVNMLKDFYIGWWHDADLGNFNDDFIGCDTLRNTGFIYNGDNDDEGPAGYGVNPPMQSYIQLDGPTATADNFDNDHDGTTDEAGEKILLSNFMYYNNDFSIYGNPQSCQDFYNYLRSVWRDGSHLTTSYNGLPGMIVNHIFSGTPYSIDPNDWWSETGIGDTPADRRFIMSCGPTTIPPASRTNVEYAIVFSHYADAPNGANTSFALNNAYVDKITDWYNTQSFPSCYDPTPVAEIPADNSKLIVYPNPATNVVNIKLAGQTAVLDFYMTDMAGKVVLRGKGNTLNIDGLANGMYLLYVTGEKGTFYSKLIKQ